MEVKLYRPSNGTEGEMFISHWCGTCEHERERRENPDADGCEIVTWTMALPITDGQYPHEWQHGPNGPRCTAYCEDGTVAITPIDHNAVVRPLL